MVSLLLWECAVLYLFNASLSSEKEHISVTLTNDEIRRIVDAVHFRHRSIKSVAYQHGISSARVSQLVSEYKQTKVYPIIHRRGPKCHPPSDRLRDEIISLKKEFNIGSSGLAEYIREKHRIPIGSMTVHKVLLESGLTEKDPRKSFPRKKGVRYEREHSLSAVHMDWYACSDGKTNVCVVLDDASRMVLSGGEFPAQTAAYSIQLLKEAYEKYVYISPIREVITDHGTQFYAARRDKFDEADHSFENFCKEYGIVHILAKVKHPQTNGKIERWFQTYEANRYRFASFQEFIDWYNKRRPHQSLDWSTFETPEKAFYRKAVDNIRSNCISMFARELEEA